MDKQEIFNTIATHLFTQGGRATEYSENVKRDICLYRTEGGRKCAIGCLIPDDAYIPRMEGQGIGGLMLHFVHLLPVWFSPNKELLGQLQSVHDAPSSWFTNETLRDVLKGVARTFNLNDDILETLSFNRP